MRRRSAHTPPRDAGRPLADLLAWHGLEGGGWLRNVDGALSATLQVRGPRPGAALAAVAGRAARRLGAGWTVLAEVQHLPAQRRAYLTLTREPAPLSATRRAAVGRRRRRREVLDADLQLQGDTGARVEEVRRLAAGPCALHRLGGRRLADYLHATLTGAIFTDAAPGRVSTPDLPPTGGRLHHDGGLRLGDTWIVPVTVGARAAPVDGALPLAALIDRDPGPLRAVLRYDGHRRPTARPAAGSPLSVRDLLALAGGAPSGAVRHGPSPGATLLAYDTHRRRAARRAAALAERLRGAGFAAAIADADPAAAFLASLPAHTRLPEHAAPAIRMQAQRDPDKPAAPGQP